jgi:prepilin-type N-terminal cleavage/methylation domain-containing protein
MFYYLKKSHLKRSDNHHSSQGFTLIEVLMAIVIMGFTASAISYALSWMLNSNQNLTKEQNRRVEATRALDLIAGDIRMSRVAALDDTSRPALPSGITGTVVLDMDIVSGPIRELGVDIPNPTMCATAQKNRIVYSIKAVNNQNILYRHGLISNPNGKIDCDGNLQIDDGDLIADNVSIANSTLTIPAPTCGSATAPGTDGFYSCQDDNKVSIALYVATKSTRSSTGTYTNTKTYGITRNIISGDTISALPSTVELCAVPNILGQATSTANTNITNTKFASTSTTNLIPNAIRIDVASSNTTVLTQNPSPNTRILCDRGLVTYTY